MKSPSFFLLYVSGSLFLKRARMGKGSTDFLYGVDDMFLYPFDDTFGVEFTLDQLEHVAQCIVRELWEQPQAKEYVGAVSVEEWTICVGVGKKRDLRKALENVLKVVWNALILLGEVPDLAVDQESKEPKLLRTIVEELERSR